MLCAIGLSRESSRGQDLDPPKDQESDLALLARKEAERRDKLDRKGPLITNIELVRIVGRMKSGDSSPSISELDENEAREENSSEEASEVSESEEEEDRFAEFRSALREARQKVETESNSYMVLELRINHLRNLLFQEADPRRLELLERELARATEEIAAVRKAEEEARHQLDILIEEARRAGMLPGEIRETIGEIPVTRSTATID